MDAHCSSLSISVYPKSWRRQQLLGAGPDALNAALLIDVGHHGSRDPLPVAGGQAAEDHADEALRFGGRQGEGGLLLLPRRRGGEGKDKDGNKVEFGSFTIILGPTTIAESWAASYPEDKAATEKTLNSFKPTGAAAGADVELGLPVVTSLRAGRETAGRSATVHAAADRQDAQIPRLGHVDQHVVRTLVEFLRRLVQSLRAGIERG